MGGSVGAGISTFVEIVAGIFSVQLDAFLNVRHIDTTAVAKRVIRRRRAAKPSRREREYDGEFRMPARAYEATSKIISVIIRPGLWAPIAGSARLLEISEAGRTRFRAVIAEAPANSQSFEIEVLAPELTIEGDKKQRKIIGNEKIVFHLGMRISEER